jgi:hypothetical protein
MTQRKTRTPRPARPRKSAAAAPHREVYEKLGAFYLGREYDLEAGKLRDDLFLYDARDLVTHAVCVGMTGSGKTGLGIGLLEEAALDGIPALILDPKGDLPNLALTFPELRAEDFLPWVNPGEAGRLNLTVEDFAAQQASQWAEGITAWGQDGERIRRLRQAAEVRIYTPGSRSGVPLSILHSLAAPTDGLREEDLYRDRLQSTVAGLLHLLGIRSDPIQGKEHVFLANVIDSAWQRGQNLDLAGLIGLVQTPPFDRLGVLDLETAYPAGERSALVMALNNLLAAPGFDVWLAGEPMDPASLLWTRDGKPRLAVVTLAHLSDAERMFVVTLLLNEVVAWVRRQSGTNSLRAILYMDEIFGFFPPVAEPPSKRPMLSLLKQARAHGLGVVLATQNPVDLDYRGLANTGTWFIGRLQTEGDRQRLLDGLDSLTTGTAPRWDRRWLEKAIGGLDKRVFLVNNVHEDGPAVMQTRWTLSYLRGPMTGDQIGQLMKGQRAAGDRPAEVAATVVAAAVPASSGAPGAARPAALPPEIAQVSFPARAGLGSLTYIPMLVGAARLRYVNAKLKIDSSNDVVYLTAIKDAPIPVDWAEARAAGVVAGSLLQGAPAEGAFGEVAAAGMRERNYKTWERDFLSWLAGAVPLTLWRDPVTGETSQPGETEAAFRARQSLEARQSRDQTLEKLRAKYAARLTSLKERLRRAEQTVEREKDQARQQQTQTAISFGATVLGAFVGRKAVSATTLGRATTAARGVSRVAKEKEDIERAADNVEALRARLADAEAELESEVNELEAELSVGQGALEPIQVRPKKADIAVQLVALAWTPHTVSPSGELAPAWG